MKKFIILCLAAAGFAGLPVSPVSAHEAPAVAVAPVSAPVNALPAVARVNLTVVVGAHRHHRRFRSVRRVYYRHGRRVVVYRRIYY